MHLKNKAREIILTSIFCNYKDCGLHLKVICSFLYLQAWSLRAATDESQKTLNKCETRNKTVFDTRLRHPETINSVPLNSVLRIKQTCV